jgi:hypothetical protein
MDARLFARHVLALAVACAAAFAAAGAASAQRFPSPDEIIEDVWKPAPTPPGGVSWELLETTIELTRIQYDVIYSRPSFPDEVRALDGKRIKVAGWMMPLEAEGAQSHFVLLAYPPGCPFHLHALPNQFIEVKAATPVRLDEMNATIVSGVLELTGEDESGIFYRLTDARHE